MPEREIASLSFVIDIGAGETQLFYCFSSSAEGRYKERCVVDSLRDCVYRRAVSQ